MLKQDKPLFSITKGQFEEAFNDESLTMVHNPSGGRVEVVVNGSVKEAREEAFISLAFSFEFREWLREEAKRRSGSRSMKRKVTPRLLRVDVWRDEILDSSMDTRP